MKMNKDQSETECKTSRLLNIEPWRAATVQESLEKEKLMIETEMRLPELEIKPKESEVNFELHFQKYELHHTR